MMDNRYPWYCQTDADRDIMYHTCRRELETWRIAVAHRLSLSVGKRCEFWVTLAQSFDELQMAFRRVQVVAVRKAA